MTSSRWAPLHEESLRQNQPAQYRALKASGRLAAYLAEVEESAEASYETIRSQLMRQDPGPASYLQRVQHLRTLDGQAKELVMHDLLVPDEETQRAIEQGGYLDPPESPDASRPSAPPSTTSSPSAPPTTD